MVQKVGSLFEHLRSYINKRTPNTVLFLSDFFLIFCVHFQLIWCFTIKYYIQPYEF